MTKKKGQLPGTAEQLAGAIFTDLPMVDNIPQIVSPQPKAGKDPAPAKSGLTRFRVNRPITGLAHGPDSYPVKDGFVELPTDARWYAHFITNGTLTKE